MISKAHSQHTITGTITDASTQQALSGVHVAAGTEMAISRKDGGFSLRCSNLPCTINISHVGYVSKKIVVKAFKDSLQVNLKPEFSDIDEIVITPTHQFEPLKQIPYSVQFINQQEIEQNNNNQAAFLLNRIPGLHMQHGTLNTNRITMRGIGARVPFGTNKIRAYYGPIPLTNGAGETVLEDMDFNSVKRIEVIKGPNSSLYGAGLGGVIHLIPNGMHGNNINSFETTAQVGDFRSFGLNNAFEYHFNRTGFRLGQDYFTSHGYRDNNQYNKLNLNFTGNSQLKEGHDIYLVSYYSQLKAGIPSSLNREMYLQQPTAAAPQWAASQGYEDYQKYTVGVGYDGGFNENLAYKAAFLVNYKNLYEPRFFNILSSHESGVGTRHTIGFKWLKVNVQAGVELFADQYQYKTYENLYQDFNMGSVQGGLESENAQNRWYANGFANINYNISDRWNISTGINTNITQYRFKVDDVNDTLWANKGTKRFEPVVSPRLGTVFRFFPWMHWYLSASHGFSVPTPDESMLYDGSVNTSLQAEKGINFETGIRSSMLQNSMQAEVTFYHMLVSDLLVARRDALDVFVATNAGQTVHSGIEYMLSYKKMLLNDLLMDIYSSGTFTRYRFLSFEDGEEDYSGNILTGFPDLTWRGQVDFSYKNGLYFSATSLYTGDMPLNDANTVYSDPYWLFHLKMGYTASFNNIRMHIYGNIRNLFDTKYAAMFQINAQARGEGGPRYYYPGNPRHYFGGIKLIYHLY